MPDTPVPDTLLVAAAQIDTDADLPDNLAKIEARMNEAAGLGCQVLLFHEGCLTGYPDDERVEVLDFSWIEAAEQQIQRLAGQLGMAVLLGTTSRRDGHFFNDLLIIDADGRRLGRYAKTWRAGEPWYAAGSGPVIFRVCGVEGTAIICHDLRYPELTRLGVAAGARIVFISNNESGLTAEQKLLGYRSMQISRATENLAYAVMANAPADARDMGRRNSSHGNSMIVDVMGNVLDEAGSFEQRLVVARLDLLQATGSPARRTLGQDDSRQLYGTDCEHPAYAEWIRAGLGLVRRLDGQDLGQRRRTWVREPGARIQGSRDLDRDKVQAPGIVRDPSGEYRLFYTAIGPAKPFPSCQGYILSAFSEDGLNFRPDPGIRVAPNPAMPHSSLRLLAPTVTQCGEGRWRMYYESRGTADCPTVICSAISTDLMHWKVEEGIRFSAQDGVGGPSFIHLPDGRGRLFCFASEFDAGGLAGGRRLSQSVISAVTTDGLTFEPDPGFRMRDRYSTQEDVGITAAEVILPREQGQPWTMLYSAWQDVPPGTEVPRHPSHDPDALDSGRSVDFAAASIASDLAGYRSRIFSARSADGLSWEREGCVLDGAGYGQDGIDAIHAEDMSLIRLDDGTYRMYYAACDNDGNWRIASARSDS